MTLDIHDPRYAREEQELTDARVKRILGSRQVKHARGKIVGVDVQTMTCAALVEGATVASPGIRYGEHIPQVGDQVLLVNEGLAGGRYLLKILSRTIPDAYLKITDRGAVTTPGVDNSPAISAAIEELNAAGGGILRVPIGTFDAAKIAMRSYVVLRGDGPGSVLRLPNSTDGDVIKMVVAAGQGQLTQFAGVESLTVDGNKGNQANGVDQQQLGISIFPARDCWVDTVWVRDTQRSAIYFAGPRNRVSNATLSGIGKVGPAGSVIGRSGIVFDKINTEYPTGSVVDRNIVMDCLEHGIKVYDNGDHSLVTNNRVYAAQERGIYINGNSYTVVSHNTIDGASTAGIFIGDSRIGGKGCVVSGNTVTGILPYLATAGHGILVWNHSDTQVIGNTVQGCQGHGIDLISAPGATITGNTSQENGLSGGGYAGIVLFESPYFTIAGNHVRDNGTVAGPGTGILLFDSGTPNIHGTIVGNTVYDTHAGAARVQAYGIQANNASDYNVVGPNTVYNHLTADISLAGTHNTVPARPAVLIGPFFADDMIQSTTQQMAVRGQFYDSSISFPTMDRSGRILGELLVASAARTAGSVIAYPWVAGVGYAFAGNAVTIDATNPRSVQSSVAWESGRVFTAGQTIGMSIVADATWAPDLTTDFTGWLMVSFDDFTMPYIPPGSLYQPLDQDLTEISKLTTTVYGRSLLTSTSAPGGGPTGAAGGELGGTYPNPTVNATHSGSAHHGQSHDHSAAADGTALAPASILATGAIGQDVIGATNNDLSRYTADTTGISVRFNKSRGATVGAHTVVNVADQLGTLTFRGSTGAAFANAAQIKVNVGTGTPGAASMPGSLGFYTTPDGSTTVALRLTINAAGQLVIAEASDIVLGTTTGTKIGTATTQKLGFYGVAAIVQPAAAAQAAAPAGGVGTAAGGWDTAANRDSAIATINALRTALVNLGLIKGAA